MNISEGIVQTFDVIRGNKIRAFLTMLGINFGVGSLIAIAIIGLAFRASISSEMGQYGSQLIWISINNEAYTSSEGATLMDQKDISYFTEKIPGVRSHTSILNGRSSVSYRGKRETSRIIGVLPGHFDIFSFELQQGRFFLEQDMQLRRRVCVLRSDIAVDLFGDEDPLGKWISVYNNSYRVVGVMKQLQNQLLNDGGDNSSVYIPAPYLGAKLWGGRPIQYWVYMLKFESLSQVEPATERIESYLDKKYGRLRGKPRFQIEKFESFIEMINKILDVISTLVLVIASVSLVVGGLGIMNIMLVTVTERTREIGIRMAIGARRKDILSQFIMEAVTLCLIGGGTGVLFGIGIAALVCLLAQWPFVFSLLAVVVALSISTVIGLLFGIYPAYKASQLMPIEALRVENG